MAAGVDIVALDAGRRADGQKAHRLRPIVKGQEVGLGKMDYRSLDLRELAVS